MTDYSRLSAASSPCSAGFSGELTCGVSGVIMLGRRELIYRTRLCNFLAFVLFIIFVIFSVFPVVAPRWQHSSGRS